MYRLTQLVRICVVLKLINERCKTILQSKFDLYGFNVKLNVQGLCMTSVHHLVRHEKLFWPLLICLLVYIFEIKHLDWKLLDMVVLHLCGFHVKGDNLFVTWLWVVPGPKQFYIWIVLPLLPDSLQSKSLKLSNMFNHNHLLYMITEKWKKREIIKKNL